MFNDVGKKIVSVFKRIQYNSPVVLTFTLLAFASLLVSEFTGGAATKYVFSVYRGSPADPLFYVRLLGHSLGHANFEHFFSNFLMILLAGPMLEDKYGSKNILIAMLLTSLVTGLAFIAVSPDKALLGASGIVFMFILLSSFTNLKQGKIPVTLIMCVLIFIGREVVNSFSAEFKGVSQVTHILGGVCGASFGFYLNRHKLVSIKDE